MNRLGIFLLYDKYGIVDDYIIYLLDEMQTIYNKLVIVCNCMLECESKKNYPNTQMQYMKEKIKALMLGDLKMH